MRTFLGLLVGLFAVVLVLAGAHGNASALVQALTGAGLQPLDPNANPTRGPAGAAPPVNTGPPIGTGPTPSGGGVPYGQQIPGLPPIPGLPYPGGMH